MLQVVYTKNLSQDYELSLELAALEWYWQKQIIETVSDFLQYRLSIKQQNSQQDQILK